MISNPAYPTALEIKKLPLYENYLVDDQDKDPNTQWPNPSIPAVASHIIPDLAILHQKHKFIDLNMVRTHVYKRRASFCGAGTVIISDAETVLPSE